MGFEIFAKRPIDHVIESAFGGVRDVLSFFAILSPQAAHYHEILTLLAKSIAKQRERFASKGRSRYVTKILTLDRRDGPDRDADGEERSLPHSADVGPSAAEQWDAWVSGNHTPLEQGGESIFGRDTLDISHWDMFPFVP